MAKYAFQEFASQSMISLSVKTKYEILWTEYIK